MAIEQITDRVAALEATLEAVSQEPLYRAPVGCLRCFRRIDTVTALTLVAELHDFRCFHSARERSGSR